MKKRSRRDIAGVLCILCLLYIAACGEETEKQGTDFTARDAGDAAGGDGKLRLLPGDWIPEKLIDWNGWRENIRQFPICNIVPEHSKV